MGTMQRLGTVLNANRERAACLLALGLLLVAVGTPPQRSWPSADELGPARVAFPVLQPLPAAPPQGEPLDQTWTPGLRDPFTGAVASRGPAAGPVPAAVPLVPPPPDPAPSLYRGVVLPSAPHLLFLAAPPRLPRLEDGTPCTIQARPHDIVQAPGDPEPIEGTLRRDREGNVLVKGGRVWFYLVKPRGLGHPKNPLAVDELLVYKPRAETAHDAFQERLRQAEGKPEALVALAQDCLNGDLLREAEEALKAALRADPRHRAAALKLADLYRAHGLADAEVGVLQEAVRAGPDFAAARLRLGLRCLEFGLVHLACEHFDRGVEAAARVTVAEVAAGEAPLPEDALARRLLLHAAEVRILQQALDQARSLLDALAAALPDDPAFRNARALAHLMGGQPQRAAALLAEVPDAAAPPVCALNTLGAALFLSGDPDTALEHFLACRATAPHHEKAMLNTLLALAATGGLAEAERLRAALPEAPAPSLHRSLVLGYLHERQGRHEEALQAYQDSLALDRTCFPAICGLARCHQAAGRAERAAECVQQARVLQPPAPERPREERRAFAFQGAEGTVLPEGWRVVGTGGPRPSVRDGALHFEGRAAAAAARQVVRAVRPLLPAETGFLRRLVAFEAALQAPYTNQAVAGLTLVLDEGTSLQAGLRTAPQAKPGRRVAWRTVRGGTPGPWTDLPGSVARDRFRLGLRFAGDAALQLTLDGKPHGPPLELPELRRPRETVGLGLFVAAEGEGQECFFTVRHVEAVWRTEPVLSDGVAGEGR